MEEKPQSATATTSTTTATELTVSRLVPATPERAWSTITDPNVLPRWFAPDMRCDIRTWDLTPGGRYDIRSAGDDGSTCQNSGTFREVDPPRRLVMSWELFDGDRITHETEVTWTLAAEGDGTRITLGHTGFPDAHARDRHHGGWSGILERLADMV